MIIQIIGKISRYIEKKRCDFENDKEIINLKIIVVREIVNGYKKDKKHIVVGASIRNANVSKKTLVAVVDWLKKKSFYAEYFYYTNEFENTIHIDLYPPMLEQDPEVKKYLDELPAEEQMHHCGTCGGRLD